MKSDFLSKILLIIIIVLTIIVAIIFFYPKSDKKVELQVEAKEVILSRTELSLIVDGEYQIVAIVSPSNSVDKSIKWSSSDDNVVTIDESGNIKAKKVGNATIIATTSNGKTAKCIVTVENKVVAIKSISLSSTDIVLGVGDSTTLKVKITPSNSTEHKITWTSSNPSVATVKDGVVKAISVGNTLITAKTSNGKIAICDVEVLKSSPPNIPADQSSKPALVKNVISVKQGSIASLTLSPSDSKAKWSSDKKSVATVDEYGNITGVGVGTAIITVETSSGTTLTASVIVIGRNSTIVSTYDSSTFKYWIQKIKSTSGSIYAVTHIWMQDPYNQLKVAHSYKYIHPTTIIQNEIDKYGYQKKGLIATNASASSDSGYPIINFLIDDGKLIKSGGSTANNVNGLNKNLVLSTYTPNDAGKEKALKEGVKYTFGFKPVLIQNGVVQTSTINSSGDSTFINNNIRQAVCQVDKNNYILITSTDFDSDSGSRLKYGISLINLANMLLDYNCKMAYNLDGGTSTYYAYKGSTSTINRLKTTFPKPGRSDVLYYVEK